jgi:hypothetical protein
MRARVSGSRTHTIEKGGCCGIFSRIGYVHGWFRHIFIGLGVLWFVKVYIDLNKKE